MVRLCYIAGNAELGLRIKLTIKRRIWIDNTAIIDDDGRSRCLKAGKVYLNDIVLEKREGLVESPFAVQVSRGGLVDRTIPPAQVYVLISDTHLARISVSILVRVVEYGSLKVAEPLVHKDCICQVNGSPGRIYDKRSEIEDMIEGKIPGN